MLADVLARLDVRDRLSEYRVWRVWNEAVGEILASRTEPLKIENGRLILRVVDSAWMQELQFLKGEIQRKVNGALGAKVVKNIFLVQGEITPRRKATEKRRGFDVDEAAVEELVPEGTKPEIAEALRRVARAQLRRFGRFGE